MQPKNFNGKIGSYAISTVDFNSWSQTPTNSNKKNKKNRSNKQLINKIFADYSELVDDPFWIEKFKNASHGKFPTKFSYKNDSIIYKKASKSNTLELPKNKLEGVSACIHFFQTHGSIFSPLDIQKTAELEQIKRINELNTQQELSWSNSNKKVQECLLSYYVISMKENLRLTENEMEQLREIINLGIVDKFFGKHNITIKNKRINNIDGLMWDSELRYFFIDPNLKPVASRGYTRKKHGPPSVDPSLKDMVSNFGSKWSKYLESLSKKWEKELRRQDSQNLMGQNLEIPSSPSFEETTNSFTDTTDIDDDDD